MPFINPSPSNQPPQTTMQQMQAMMEKIEQASDPKEAEANQLRALAVQEIQADGLPNGPEKVEALKQVAEGYRTRGMDQRAHVVELKIKLVENQMTRDAIGQDLNQVSASIKRSGLSLW